MVRFIAQNWGTLLVCLIVLAAMLLCVRSLVRARKGGCCGDCSRCSCCCGTRHPQSAKK